MIVAFDLDGTLITVATKQSFSLRSIAKRFNVSLDPAKIWKKKREGFSNLQLLKGFGVDSILAEKISLIWKREIETPYWLSLDVPIDDAFQCLLKANEVANRCILVTARSNQFLLRQELIRLGLNRFFSEIYCVDPMNSIEEKNRVLRESGVDCFFGDTETDFEAANLAKVSFFSVSTGQRSEKFLNDHGIRDVNASLSEAMLKAI